MVAAVPALARQWRHAPVRSATARLAMLPVSAVTSFVVARTVLHAVGPRYFGIVTMLASLTALLPFADLGVGTAVTNAVADDRDEAPPIINAALRRLALVGASTVLVAGSISAAGLWPALLGASADLPHLNRAMVALAGVFSLGLPLSIGPRILIGMNRYATVVMLQAVASVITVVIALALSRHSHNPELFVLLPVLGQSTANLLALVTASRHIAPELRACFRRTTDKAPCAAITRVARPMLIVSIGLPVGLQTDRLLLSHLATARALSDYALVATAYAPAWSVVSSAGMALWPYFRTLRRSGTQGTAEYLLCLRLFGLAGLVGAVVLIVLGPPFTRLWSGIALTSPLLWPAFGLLLLVQSIHLPGGMYLTSPAGLRYQARCVTVMVLLNLPLSILLIPALGAAGTVFGSALATLAAQLVPSWRTITRQGDR